MVRVYLYGTQGCHLCADAEKLLVSAILDRSPKFELQSFDIANDDVLLDRYQIRIPVVKREDTGKELNWPFDWSRVIDFLR